MSQPAVHQPAVNGDRWEAVKEQACPQGKRSIDVNHHRREVRWFCDRCRKTHTYRVGDGVE
jgi:transposase-like protein